MSNQNKQDAERGGRNSLVSGVTIAIIVAGIAAVGVMLLKDKKNRNKFNKELINVKDRVIEFVDSMKNQAQDKADEVRKELVKG